MFISKVTAKYKVQVIASNKNYDTTLPIWKEGEKVYAYFSRKDARVDITDVFKGHDIKWLNDSDEDNAIDVDLKINVDFSPPSRGSFYQPPEGSEISTNTVHLKHENINLDVTGLLKVRLSGNKTWEDVVEEDMADYFGEEHRRCL